MVFPSTSHIQKFRERRASEITSGSITIEAAFVVPIFFLAMICILYFFEIMAIQTSVKEGIAYIGKKQMEEMYPTPIVSIGKLERELIVAIGAERLDRSIIVGGAQGIHCENSFVSLGTKILTIEVNYKVKLPIPLFTLAEIEYKETAIVKGWTGYVKTGTKISREEVVYITETGIVYHTNYRCTYLDLSIHLVPKDGIEQLKNDYQERYKPCERCGNNAGEKIYITDKGNRYHSDIGCSGLKRSIYAVPLSEALGKGACSRCAQ